MSRGKILSLKSFTKGGKAEPLLFVSDGLIGIESIIKEICPYAEFQSVSFIR